MLRFRAKPLSKKILGKPWICDLGMGTGQNNKSCHRSPSGNWIGDRLIGPCGWSARKPVYDWTHIVSYSRFREWVFSLLYHYITPAPGILFCFKSYKCYHVICSYNGTSCGVLQTITCLAHSLSERSFSPECQDRFQFSGTF